MRNILCLLLLFVLFSCERGKEFSIRERLSGPKRMERYQWIKQDSSGNFTRVIHDTANLAKLLLWDNGAEELNNVTYDGAFTPAGWYYANIGVGTPRLLIGWYADFEEMKSFTFWSEESLGGKSRVTYTLDLKRFSGKMHLEAVYHTKDGVFKEVIDLADL
jgi:hypothetical protein